MGGADWQKAKAKVKSAADDFIAATEYLDSLEQTPAGLLARWLDAAEKLIDSMRSCVKWISKNFEDKEYVELVALVYGNKLNILKSRVDLRKESRGRSQNDHRQRQQKGRNKDMWAGRCAAPCAVMPACSPMVVYSIPALRARGFLVPPASTAVSSLFTILRENSFELFTASLLPPQSQGRCRLKRPHCRFGTDYRCRVN